MINIHLWSLSTDEIVDEIIRELIEMYINIQVIKILAGKTRIIYPELHEYKPNIIEPELLTTRYILLNRDKILQYMNDLSKIMEKLLSLVIWAEIENKHDASLRTILNNIRYKAGNTIDNIHAVRILYQILDYVKSR